MHLSVSLATGLGHQLQMPHRVVSLREWGEGAYGASGLAGGGPISWAISLTSLTMSGNGGAVVCCMVAPWAGPTPITGRPVMMSAADRERRENDRPSLRAHPITLDAPRTAASLKREPIEISSQHHQRWPYLSGAIRYLGVSTPACSTREHDTEGITVDRGGEPQDLAVDITTEPAQGRNQRPAGHRSGIVVAAFDLIPRVAAIPVMAFACGCHESKPLFHTSFVAQVCGDLVFDARPHFVGVDKRLARPPPSWPATEQEAALVVEGVGALQIDVVPQRPAKVVAIDGLQRCAHAVRRQQIAEMRDVGQKLT